MTPARESPDYWAFKLIGVACAVAAWAMGMWFAWFGWDRNHLLVDSRIYAVAPNTPRAWQVLGCGIAIAGVVVIAYFRIRVSGFWSRNRAAAWVLAPVASLGFAVVWTWDIANDPTQDGLFLLVSFQLVTFGSIALRFLLAISEGWARKNEDRDARNEERLSDRPR